MGISN